VPIVHQEDVLSPLAWPRKQQAVARGGVAKCAALFIDPLGLGDAAALRDPYQRYVAGSPRNVFGVAGATQRRGVEEHDGQLVALGGCHLGARDPGLTGGGAPELTRAVRGAQLSGVRGFVAPTDHGWYQFFLARRSVDEANFWRPGGTGFHALRPGEPFFFKLKAPHLGIGGFGLFARFARLPVWLGGLWREQRRAR
jgi:hypothetical protein